MWIEELDVRGFRRLRGVWRFAPGLNLVLGDNEAGKSSLHDALIRALHGFSRIEQRRTRGPSVLERCAPWKGGEFGVCAVLREAGGRSLRVEWDFAGPALRLLDADTGEDLTAEVPFARGEAGLGRRLLGLDLQEFREACCLDQTAVGAVRRTEDLVLALQQAVESTAGDVGVEEAVERLGRFLHELGVHGGHLRDLPGGRLAALRQEREAVERELAGCEAARARTVELAAELAEREFSLDVVRRSARELEQGLRLAEHAELEDRLGRAGRLAERAADAPAAPLLLPQDAVRAVPALLDAVDAAGERIRALEERLARERDVTVKLEAERDDLTARVDALAAYASADRGSEARLRELRGRRLALAAHAARGPAAAGPERATPVPDPGAVRRSRETLGELAALAARAEATGWAGGRLLASFLLAGVGVAAAVSAAVLLVPRAAGLAAAALLAAGACWMAFTARPGPSRAPLSRKLRESLRELGVASLAELEARVARDEARLAAARHVGEQRDHDRADALASLEALDRETVQLLDRAGAVLLNPLAERVEAYLVACAKAAERLELLARLEAVRAAISERSLPARELREWTAERAGSSARLAAQLAPLGIDASDPRRARQAWDEVARRAEADRLRSERARAATNELRSLLGGQTLDELEDRMVQAGALLDAHVRRHGRLARAVRDRTAIEAERERVDGDLRELEAEATRLRTQIRDREAELGDPAELKERREELAQRIRAAERARDAVALARDELKSAAREAHRRFAPHLNAALERHLPTLTGRRYVRAAVDDALGVQVQAPETGRMVAAAELSRGTQDQIYLLQRLEIVRLLDPDGGRIPVLLDDPFARMDEGRLRGALAVLADVAADRQVILFTEDRGLATEVRAVCPACAVLELPAPAERAGELPPDGRPPEEPPPEMIRTVREPSVQMQVWP